MAIITGTNGNDIVSTSAASLGVTGGLATIGADSISGLGGNDSISGGGGNDTILGGNGDDTLSGEAGNDVLYSGDDTGSDRLYGGDGNDSLYGHSNGAGYALLEGGTGSDTIYGYGFYGNVASYLSATSGVSISLPLGVAFADGIGDVLVNVVAVQSSNFNDTIAGDSAQNYFYWSLGSDNIDGGAGSDQLSYYGLTSAVIVNLVTGSATKASGIDTLVSIEDIIATAQNDSITGSSANEFFRPLSGNDTIDGGAGFDWVSYDSSVSYFGGPLQTQGVVVSLVTGTAVDNFGNTDTLSNIEALYGSSLADDLTGIALANGSRSFLRGLAGADTLRAVTADTRVTADYGGDGAAVLVNLSASSQTLAGLVIPASQGRDAFGAFDTYVNIQSARGTSFDDVMVGSSRADYLDGGAGADLLSSGNGNDTLDGGAGNDTLNGEAGDDYIIGSLGADSIDGGSGTNVLDYGNLTQQINITYTSYAAGSVVKSGGTTDAFTNVQRVWGGSGDDFLSGSAASLANGVALWLRGNAGNDVIDGASSRGLALDYSNSPSAIIANISAGTVQDGFGGTDTLINVRRLNLSGYNDSVVGGSFGDVFHMELESGSHTIDGGGSSDRGNEIRYGLTTATTIDLGWTPASGGGYVGTVVKSNGLTDYLTRFTRAVGGAGNDTILGTPTDDVLEGEAGNDVINGRTGFDYVGFSTFPQSGAPTRGAVANLSLGTAADPWGGNDTLIDIEGIFGTVFGDDFAGRDLGFANRSALQGAGGNDTLRGAANGFTSADYINDPLAVNVNLATGTGLDGYGNIDTLIAINAIRGSAFNDTLVGSAGDDSIQGGTGNDTLTGSAGLDRLLGEDGNDSIDGGADVDTITGGKGQDTLTGGTGGDRFNFTLTASPGEQSSRTTQDLITDFSVAEGDYFRLTSTGAASPDIWYAGQVATAYAALNADIALPAWTAPAGITSPLPVFWIPHTTTGGWVVVDENSNGVLEASEFAVRLQSTSANSGLRISGSSIVTPGLIGDGSSNTIFITAGVAGGARGLGGDDVIYGGGSFDNMAGGLGDDQYVVRNKETTLIELANEGEDTAYFTVSDCTNGANIEIGRLVDAANLLRGSAIAEQLVANASVASALYGNGGDDTLWSSALADTLDGGDGDDIIRGQGGADVMYGGLGNDQFVVFAANAQVIEYLNGGYDTVYVASASFTLGANIEVGRLSAAGAVALYGSATSESLVANPGEASTLEGNGGDDTLYGSAYADTLRGGAGDDIMRGQGGNDVMVGGLGNDQYVMFSSNGTIIENADEGYDILYFAGAGTFTFSASLEQALLSGSGTGLTYTGVALNKLLAGNSSGLASTINAGAGDDIIYGTAAGDTLLGGFGNDTIYTQGGADRLQYGITNFGFDIVAGFDQVAGAKLQFFSGSGITNFSQVSLNAAGGNTQVTTAAGSILVFGATLTQTDFLFG